MKCNSFRISKSWFYSKWLCVFKYHVVNMRVFYTLTYKTFHFVSSLCNVFPKHAKPATPLLCWFLRSSTLAGQSCYNVWEYGVIHVRLHMSSIVQGYTCKYSNLSCILALYLSFIINEKYVRGNILSIHISLSLSSSF